MVFLSRKIDYAILVLYHLMNHESGTSARELAEKYNLSKAFIANILKELCQGGLIKSQRGANGGYRLAKPAGDISVREIIGKLEGDFQLTNCTEMQSVSEHQCELASVCPVRHPLRKVHERMLAILGSVTLADLQQSPMELVSLESENLANEVAHLLG